MILNLNHEGKALESRSRRWKLDYRELRTKVAVLTERLIALRPGAPVQRFSPPPFFLTMDGSEESVVSLLACLHSGAAVALLPAGATDAERQSYIRTLGQGLCLDKTAFGKRIGGEPIELDPGTRLILFTSGTTGAPKAVQLSERNIISNTSAVVQSLGLAGLTKATPQARQLLFLKLNYSFGLLGQLLPFLNLGYETQLCESVLEAGQRLQEGQDEQANSAPTELLSGVISGVPSQLKALAQFASGHSNQIVCIVSAGAYLPVSLRRELLRVFPSARVTSNYGQTEASPRILSFGSEDPDFFTETRVGYLVENLRAKLADDGELLVAGPQIMLGYAGDPQATHEKVRDGWLHTGDLAAITERGLVSIVGRKDDQIKAAGERINPIEIESIVTRLLHIEECIVFAVPGVDGDSVLALGLLENECRWTPKGLRELLGSGLSNQRIPKLIYLCAELPRSPQGKLQRKSAASLLSKWKKI